jgi:ABC-type branched-subunit amino acid transport system ATPase component/ABC-type branched-subunit amino acid transport system permease subunit
MTANNETSSTDRGLRMLIRRKPVRYALLALLLLLLVAMPFLASDYQLAILVSIFLAIIGSVSTNMLVGVANQASIGNAAFLAIGAFSGALVSTYLGWNPVFAILSGGVVAAVIGLIVAIPAVRVRGLYLIIATLALHYIVLYLLTRYQGSTVGIGGFTVPPITFPGLTLQQGWYYIAGVVALVTGLVMRNLLRSKFGRAWFSMARDEVASRALGVNLFKQKLAVFGLSSFLLGIEGALLGYYIGVVSSDQFTFDLAVSYVAMVVVGGLGSVAGSVLGAIFVIGLPYLVTWLTNLLPVAVATVLSTRIFALESLLYGVAIVGFIVFEPRGLIYIWRRIVARVAGLIRKRSVVPTVLDDAGVVVEVVERSTGAPTKPKPNERVGDAVLSATGLQVTYNRLSVAVDGISISVGRREIVVMLGANGAGKTTTLRGLSGFLPAENARVSAGEVLLEGERVDGKLPFELARRGLVLVPEREKVFKTLTVNENLAVVPTRRGGDRAGMMALINDIFPALKDLRTRPAGYLSGGERQMLAIAKALVSDPRVLLVDELSLGIAPFLVTRLMSSLNDIRKARDISIVLVEQNAPAALAIADYAYVLQTGEVLLEGTGKNLLEDAEVQRLYLGGSEPGQYGNYDAAEHAPGLSAIERPAKKAGERR